MPNRPVPPIALQFLKGAEGCRLTAYQDPGGVWTIGYGHTGPGVGRGLTWNVNQANDALASDADDAANRLAERVTEYEILKLSENQYAAMLSFVFNLGAGNWTIFDDLNHDNLDDVPTQMLRFDHGIVAGKSQVIPGLLHRRMAEIALWNGTDAGNAVMAVERAPVAPPSSGYTRRIITPPTVVAKPLALPSLLAKIGVAAIGLSALASQALPLAHQHYYLSTALSGLVVACGVVSLAISRVQAVLATH